MSDEELRNQINKIAVEIEKIEESAKQKEAYVRKRLNEEFDPKISVIEAELKKQQAILDEIIKSIEELEVKKKDMMPIVKDLEKKYSNLKKEKEKYITDRCKAISKEKKMKTKVIDRNIKIIEKELKTLDKK
jgi:hypothetical protein